jgi:hypothetical protein
VFRGFQQKNSYQLSGKHQVRKRAAIFNAK